MYPYSQNAKVTFLAAFCTQYTAKSDFLIKKKNLILRNIFLK